MSFGRLPLDDGVSQPVFGLPGNPASAFVTFELFVRPFLEALAGHIKLHRQTVTARAAMDLTTAEDITAFLRVRLSRSGADLEASLTGPQGSGLVGSLGAADGLAVIPEGVRAIPRGAPVELMLLDHTRGLSSTPVDSSQRIVG